MFPPRAGIQLDRYLVETLVGSGAMGSVYRAYDTRLERPVALKILDGNGSSPGEAVSTALREARAAAAIRHPAIASIFDVGSVDGLSYIVMELVRGTSMVELVGDPTIEQAVRVRWLVDLADALGCAHGLGIVHRDVKPSNVLVREDGLIKILDFGVAQLPAALRAGSATMSDEELLTLSGGGLVGTPDYMAPELIRGQPTDARVDQFSWGVLAYELLTGTLPWPRGTDPFRTLLAILGDAPVVFPPRVTARPEVKRVVLRALSKDPAGRFGSMAEIVEALAPHAAPAIPRSGPWSTSATAAGGPPPSSRSGRMPVLPPGDGTPRPPLSAEVPRPRPSESTSRYTPSLRPELGEMTSSATRGASRRPDPSPRHTPVWRSETPLPPPSPRPSEPSGRYTPALRPEVGELASSATRASRPSPTPTWRSETPLPPASPRPDPSPRHTPVWRADSPLPPASPRPDPPASPRPPAWRGEAALETGGGRRTPALRPDLPPLGGRHTPAFRPEVPSDPPRRPTPALRPEVRDEPARRGSSGAPPPEGMREPNVFAPVDLPAHLSLLPPNAATKGMFVADLLQASSKHLTPEEVRTLAGVVERRVFPFSNYPMNEYLKIQVVVARTLHRDVALGEGLRRLGLRTFDTLLGSQVGKTLFGPGDGDAERLLVLLGRAHDLTFNFGTLGVEKAGPACLRMRARDMPIFLETYQVGVIEGVLRHAGQRGSILVETAGLADATFEIQLF